MANDFLQPATPLGSAPLGTSQAEVVQAKFSWEDAYQRYSYIGLLAFTTLLVYAFWNMLELTSKFWEDAQYSHGYLVPLIALYLMWSRRPNPSAHEPHDGESEETFLGFMPASQAWQGFAGLSAALMVGGIFVESQLMQGAGVAALCIVSLGYILIGQPFEKITEVDRWIGFGVILAAFGIRILAANWSYDPIDRVCFVLALAGLFFMVGGIRLIAWAGPAIGFLIFMFPLPSVLEQFMLGNLQKLASIGSEIILTIINIPMTRQGNQILLDGVEDALTVAEACSGLRMLTIFGAMSVAMVFLINRPWWDKFIILVSAIPIALIVNILRIVVTALLYLAFPDSELMHRIVHDYAGFAMMPAALGLLYLEMKLLSMLTLPEEGMEIHAAGVPH